ncbi:MAG: hypothetical protein K0R57_2723 [Paenibacillaceae bacterium]|nr:hypothetical protein [Paenibacillaceae bacterium]
MGSLSISPDRQLLMRDGKPFFYLADTVWSVFDNASEEEWETYLEVRRAQGFNAVQISVLPILHDASGTSLGVAPFVDDGKGNWDFLSPNPVFFDKAERMVARAVEYGMLPALVVLWCNYIPGSWANASPAGSRHTMPIDAAKPFAEYVGRRFAAYDPVYFISGDTRFEDERVNGYYQLVLDSLKAVSPEALTALHPGSCFHQLPEQFVDSANLDCYIYQSGHGLATQPQTYALAEAFLAKPVKRPIINSEPCYEAHGHGNQYGRFGAFDVRRAFWSSVLAGAKAGFTYGAHGIWSWHRKGAAFNNEGWSKVPPDWKTALRLPGAWDAGYARWLYEQYGMHDLENAQKLLLMPYPDIRVGANPDRSRVVVYVPYDNHVRLQLDLSGYEVTKLELASRNVMKPAVAVEDGISIVEMSEVNADALIIALKR